MRMWQTGVHVRLLWILPRCVVSSLETSWGYLDSHRCAPQPGVFVFACAWFQHTECKTPPPMVSSYSEQSVAMVMHPWPGSALTLVGDLWHLGHGQGQKVSYGRRATRALAWLALWHARCPLHLQRSPPSQFAPLICICYREKTISCRRFIPHWTLAGSRFARSNARLNIV